MWFTEDVVNHWNTNPTTIAPKLETGVNRRSTNLCSVDFFTKQIIFQDTVLGKRGELIYTVELGILINGNCSENFICNRFRKYDLIIFQMGWKTLWIFFNTGLMVMLVGREWWIFISIVPSSSYSVCYQQWEMLYTELRM